MNEACRLGKEIGTRRFQAYTQAFLGVLVSERGDRQRGRELAEESVRVSRELKLKYILGATLACLARASDDPAAARDALAQTEQWLDEYRVFGYKALYALRHALEVGLQQRDPALTERFLIRFEAMHRHNEPSPWVELFVRRGRALLDHMRGARDAGHAARLRALIEDPRFAHMKMALQAVHAALGECTAEP